MSKESIHKKIIFAISKEDKTSMNYTGKQIILVVFKEDKMFKQIILVVFEEDKILKQIILVLLTRG